MSEIIKEVDKEFIRLERMLRKQGFIYDVSDNLYYDYNVNRERYQMRIGVSGPYCDETYKSVLFNGGYSYKVGEYRSAKTLLVAIKRIEKLNQAR